MNIEALNRFREAFVIAVGDKSPFAKEALKQFDDGIQLIPSTVVAVPDEMPIETFKVLSCWVDSKDANKVYKAVAASLKAVWKHGFDAENINDIEYCVEIVELNSIELADPSPRITEQDAREIALAFTEYWIEDAEDGRLESFANFLRDEGNALLNKLNAKP